MLSFQERNVTTLDLMLVQVMKTSDYIFLFLAKFNADNLISEMEVHLRHSSREIIQSSLLLWLNHSCLKIDTNLGPKITNRTRMCILNNLESKDLPVTNLAYLSWKLKKEIPVVLTIYNVFSTPLSQHSS